MKLALGLVLAFGTAALVGVINGVLIRGIGLSSVITTISTFIALQGVALLLRSTPDGYYSSSVTDALTGQIGPIPDRFHRRRRGCRGKRGDPTAFAVRYGTPRGRLKRSRCVSPRGARQPDDHPRLRALLALRGRGRAAARRSSRCRRSVCRSELHAAEHFGRGSGGASIFGGRGSFFGALAGVLLIQEITSATGFLGLGTAWQYWLPGGFIWSAAGTYSRVPVGGRG